MKSPSPVLEGRTFSAGDQDVLRRCVEQIARNVVGRSPAIIGIDRVLSNFSSSYATDIIRVRLDTGADFRIFLKDFGVSQLSKDGKELRRDRELCVYRDLLADAGLGTATYYGSVWDEPAGRFWLLLELVSGKEVRSCGIEHWIEAAGWLGRLHRHFERYAHRLKDLPALLRHDVDFFRSKAAMAVRDVSHISPRLAGRLRVIVERYEPLCELMASQPGTLVHGAYRPSNILVNTDAAPVRMCAVDWELASCGSPMYDLATWTDGFKPPVLELLFDAYRQWAPLPDKKELAFVLGCFRLHRVMNWLSRSLEKQFAEAQVEKLVSIGERLDAQVHWC